MKKVIFLVAALMAVFSGVAAVSAYEGHLVDIKAHIENAIGVEKYEWDLGTLFPQQIVESDLTFGLSESFMAQNQLSSVDYNLCWELKSAPKDAQGLVTICKPVLGINPLTAPYYQALNPFLTMSLSVGAINVPDVTKTVPAEGQAVCWGHGTLYKTCSGVGEKPCETVHLSFSVPVFEGFYNAITDPAVKPANWVYSMITKDKYCLVEETLACGSIPVEVPHADLGINLKIQVSGFQLHTPPCTP